MKVNTIAQCICDLFWEFKPFPICGPVACLELALHAALSLSGRGASSEHLSLFLHGMCSHSGFLHSHVWEPRCQAKNVCLFFGHPGKCIALRHFSHCLCPPHLTHECGAFTPLSGSSLLLLPPRYNILYQFFKGKGAVLYFPVLSLLILAPSPEVGLRICSFLEWMNWMHTSQILS